LWKGLQRRICTAARAFALRHASLLVFARACELGLEGIVSKRVGSRYSSGNSWQWLKSKNPTFQR